MNDGPIYNIFNLVHMNRRPIYDIVMQCLWCWQKKINPLNNKRKS
jgi:hypothetical protein